MQNASDITTFALPGGLRIVCAPGQTDVSYVGIAVDCGTRDELDDESGMAHFAEHMSFKGTRSRSARQVITAMERVGGDLNAFTGKEETFYYCTSPRQYTARAIDLLLDVVLQSTYPEDAIRREAEVVADEIESYRDQPGELIFDDFEGLLFPLHPLGRNILGDAEALRGYHTADMLRFTERLYRPARMVLYVLGRVRPEQVLRSVERHRPALLSAAACPCESARMPFSADGQGRESRIVRERQTHQAHVVIGGRAFAATDPRHLGLCLLSNMLGGPFLSSRLNLALREKRGLVYTVETSLTAYTDTGLWTVYYGCDAHDRSRCRRIVGQELDRLLQSPLPQRTLDAARRQLKGQIGISSDNFESQAISMAKRYLHCGDLLSREQICQRLDAITPDELLQTARQAFAPESLLVLEYV